MWVRDVSTNRAKPSPYNTSDLLDLSAILLSKGNMILVIDMIHILGFVRIKNYGNYTLH